MAQQESTQQEGINQDVLANGSAGESSQPQSPSKPTITNSSRSAARKHGKGFVYLGLKDCDEALRKIDAHAKKMSIEQFAKALGHNAPKGRFLHKIEALKTFELIEPDTSEYVTLTSLAEDMLYGAAKQKARASAFLNYADFKTVYQEFPKNQDHPRQDVIKYIEAKRGIVNEVQRFLRLFLESADYAGLLEGGANPQAKVIRLRGTPTSNGTSGETTSGQGSVADAYTVMSADEAEDLLNESGLSEYKSQADVRQRITGKYILTVGDGGKITIEINRPVQITVRPENLITDLPKILEAMQQKGLEA